MKKLIRSSILASFLSICLILFLSSMAVSSPTLIKQPQDSGLTIHTPISNKCGSVISQGGFLYYSNNPEQVTDGALADNGCWLNRAEVSGNGEVYVWHTNATGRTLNSELYVFNPSKYSDIIITTYHYALTNGLGTTDVTAWDSYLKSNQNSTQILVKPGQYVELFKQMVAPNNNFGVVAAINISDATFGNAAKAVFEDLVYDKNISATKYAELDDGITGGRGVGSSFQNILNFDPIKMTANNYSAYFIAAQNDSFNGQDLVKITDFGNYKIASQLEGNYGQMMKIIIPIKNLYKDNQNFGIFIGSTGGNSYPFVRLQENSFVSSPVKPFHVYDMIQTGKMALGSMETVSFTLVIPALSSTPLVIGVRPIT